MMTPYIGEIRMFAFNFAPVWWIPCDGRLLPISDNGELFLLVGTTFGGDGKTNFALPDLRGMIAPFKPLTFCIAAEGIYPNSDPGLATAGYMGEIRMFGFNFAPGGWASCDGRLVPIGEHQALFSAMGAAFGGDGMTNFALPDLRSMVAPFKPLTFGIAIDGIYPPRDTPPDSGPASDPCSDPCIGEVRMLGFNYAPSGWALCDGRLLPIEAGSAIWYDRYQALFSLLGTTFGGDGKTNFAVPDLRGAVAPLKPLTLSIAAAYSAGDLPQRPSGA
jgi:microcystin-dependent protein